MKRKPPELDESIERDRLTVDWFTEAMRAVFSDGSLNRRCGQRRQGC